MIGVLEKKRKRNKKKFKIVRKKTVFLLETFIAEDYFVDDKKRNLGISSLNNQFFLLNFSKKQEKLNKKTNFLSLISLKLKTEINDAEIINNFGERRLETSLCSLLCLIREQSKGEEGFLSVSGHHNVAYVRNIEGILCPISIYWDWVPGHEGWAVRALECSDEDEDCWQEGDLLCLPTP